MNLNQKNLQTAVRERFALVATTPSQEKTFLLGPESAKALGYEAAEIDALPRSVTESFAGVGNPLSLTKDLSGRELLDLGSGAGLDTILAAKRVGPKGRVVGVDMTGEMVEKARRNAAALEIQNIDFIQGAIEKLPVEDASIDVVLSNGVLNLCPDKSKVLNECLRVLRPGGALLMADILLEAEVTEEAVAKLGAWSD